MQQTQTRIQKEFPHTMCVFMKEDAREKDIKNASLVTSIFTLQFMPQKDRSGRNSKNL